MARFDEAPDGRLESFAVDGLTHALLMTCTRYSQARDVFQRLYKHEDGRRLTRHTAGLMVDMWVEVHGRPWTRARR